jgi:glutaredoxin
MRKMKLRLLTLPNCGPCKALKSNLDRFQNENGFEWDYEYEVINVERRPELVEQYAIQSVPVLIFNNGFILDHNLAADKLRKLLSEQQREYDDREGGEDDEEASGIDGVTLDT